MSTTAARAGLPPWRTLSPGRYGLSGLLRSEWTKLRTVRSTMWTVAATVVLGIGVGIAVTAFVRAHWATMTPAHRAGYNPIGAGLIGVFVGQSAIGVLGTLEMSAEYGTGTIRATLSASPRRLPVLVAKAVVFGAVALVVAEVVSFGAFFTGQAILTAPAAHATLATPGALTAVAGSGLFAAMLGLFSLGPAHRTAPENTGTGVLRPSPLPGRNLQERLPLGPLSLSDAAGATATRAEAREKAPKRGRRREGPEDKAAMICADGHFTNGRALYT